MGGRKKRRKIIRRRPRGLPKVFICPRCGKQSVNVNISGKEGLTKEANVICGYCGLEAVVKLSPIQEAVDAYNIFVDKFYLGEI